MWSKILVCNHPTNVLFHRGSNWRQPPSSYHSTHCGAPRWQGKYYQPGIKAERKMNVGFFSWTTPTIWCSNKHTSTTPLTFHVSQTPLTPGSCYLNVAYLVFQDNIWNGWHDSKLQFGYSRDSILVLHLVDIMQKVICVLYPTIHYTFSFPVNLQVALFMDLIYAFCRCFYSKWHLLMICFNSFSLIH